MKNRDATEEKACKQISVDFGKLMGGDRAVFTIPVYVLRKTPSHYKVSHPEEDVCHFYLPPFCRITPYKNVP